MMVGRVLIMVVVSMWCGLCGDSIDDGESTIIVVTVLILVWDSDAGIEKGTDNRIASTNTA
jgi:hypothetical protein